MVKVETGAVPVAQKAQWAKRGARQQQPGGSGQRIEKLGVSSIHGFYFAVTATATPVHSEASIWTVD